MANGPADRLAEALSTPLEQLLVALGSGIGRAQRELDLHSIEVQRLIDEDPVLAQYGLQATWYQLPRTELELKIAVTIQEQPLGIQREGQPAPPPDQPGGRPRELVAGLFRPALPLLWAQPVNPRLQNQFSYDVQAASTVTLTIVPVPPPGRAAAGRPALSIDQALAVARPQLFPKDDLSAPPEDRVTVNYNAGAGLWYVLQTHQVDDQVELRALVRVDDATSTAVGSTGEPPP